jgi:hypothetical protein
MAAIVTTSFLALTSVVSSVYTYYASKFVSEQFHCVWRSLMCERHTQTVNSGVNAGCIITSIFSLWYCLMLFGYLFKKSKYLEAICIGTSYN